MATSLEVCAMISNYVATQRAVETNNERAIAFLTKKGWLTGAAPILKALVEIFPLNDAMNIVYSAR